VKKFVLGGFLAWLIIAVITGCGGISCTDASTSGSPGSTSPLQGTWQSEISVVPPVTFTVGSVISAPAYSGSVSCSVLSGGIKNIPNSQLISDLISIINGSILVTVGINDSVNLFLQPVAANPNQLQGTVTIKQAGQTLFQSASSKFNRVTN
jgi:hypothetical protein